MKVWVLGLVTVACSALAVSAGGPQTAIMVPISQLLAAPAKYTGKKISTRGYYSSDGHSPVLCADATAARGTEGRARIFLDLENSLIPRRSLSNVPHGYVDVTGTFQVQEVRNQDRSTRRAGHDGRFWVDEQLREADHGAYELCERSCRQTIVPISRSAGLLAKRF